MTVEKGGNDGCYWGNDCRVEGMKVGDVGVTVALCAGPEGELAAAEDLAQGLLQFDEGLGTVAQEQEGGQGEDDGGD